MEKSLVPSQPTALANVTATDGPFTGIDFNDVLIPKILMAQNTSAVVSDGMPPGTLYRSTTLEPLTKKLGDQLQFTVLSTWKSWRVSELGAKPKLRRREPFSARNQNADLEWTEDGKLMRRDRELNFYVLLVSDLQRAIKAKASGDNEDPLSVPFPCVLSFTRTSYPAGRTLVTHCTMAGNIDKPFYFWSYSLGVEKVSNDRGTFFTTTVGRKYDRKTEPLEREIAGALAKKMATTAVLNIDETEEEFDVGSMTATSKPMQATQHADQYDKDIAQTF